MKTTEWELIVKNPISNEVLSTEKYRTLKDIAEKYSNISLTTLRNIGMGRSKVYKKFIELNKKNLAVDKPVQKVGQL